MPQYVVLRASEIPVDGQMVAGMIFRLTAADEASAIQAAAAQLGERAAQSVWGVTLASNIVRRTAAAGALSYTVT